MKYEDAPDLQERMGEIIRLLKMNHIDINRVKCLRGFGSKSKRTIARCHALGKLMQRAMGVKTWYAIEFLERFDKMNKKEQDKVIIHELMHIPKTFGGGFRHHDFVCEANVDVFYAKMLSAKENLGHTRESKLQQDSRSEKFEAAKIGDIKHDVDSEIESEKSDKFTSDFSRRKEISEFKGIKETKHWWQ